MMATRYLYLPFGFIWIMTESLGTGATILTMNKTKETATF